MSPQRLLDSYQTSHSLNNLRCDGECCTDPLSKVRIIPLDDSSNASLCKSCYKEEMSFNEQRELDGLDRCLPDLPWEIYPVSWKEE